MNTAAPPSSSSLEIARRLIGRNMAPAGSTESRDVAVALQRTCRQVSDALRDSLGNDGCNALLARALARTEAQHPALTLVRRMDEEGIHLDGIVAAVEARGVAEVNGAVEALLGALTDVLGRLIGDDMALRIMDRDSASRNGGPPGAT